MTGYRVVPKEPTEAMLEAGMEEYGWPTFGGAGGCYAAMTSAAPSAADDAELVERVARAVFEERCRGLRHCYEWDSPDLDVEHPDARDMCYRQARAALKAMEQPE
jgi:hypothetical protein